MIAGQWARVDKCSIETPLAFVVTVGLYTPRVENRQRNFVRLIDIRGRGSSDKDSLNVLRSKDLRRRGGPRILGSGNERAKIP